MSLAHIVALIRNAEQDRALADALREAGGLKTLVEIGAARGYAFTEDEIAAYLDQVAPDELSDEELSAVSGGTGNLTAEGQTSGLSYKLDRCFVKSWSTSGDAD